MNAIRMMSAIATLLAASLLLTHRVRLRNCRLPQPVARTPGTAQRPATNGAAEEDQPQDPGDDAGGHDEFWPAAPG